LLTTPVKLIGLSRCLQTICALQTTMCIKINQSVSPASDKIFVYLDLLPSRMQNCNPTRVSFGKIAHGCKHSAMPSLYRDYFLAKETILWPVLRQATPTNSTGGPLALTWSFLYITSFLGFLLIMKHLWLRDRFLTLIVWKIQQYVITL